MNRIHLFQRSSVLKAPWIPMFAVLLSLVLTYGGMARSLFAGTAVGVITVGSTKDWGYNEAQAVAGQR